MRTAADLFDDIAASTDGSSFQAAGLPRRLHFSLISGSTRAFPFPTRQDD
jgi:hypothetical protein